MPGRAPTDPSAEVDALTDSMRQYYDRRADEYDDWYERRGRFDDPEANEQWRAELGVLADRVARVKGTRGLEIACGTGFWTLHLGPRRMRVAIDTSAAMLRAARTRLTCANRSAWLCRADTYRLPFGSSVFDSVVHGFWISHVPPPRMETFLTEIHRVLRPGGSVLCFDGMRPSSNAPTPTLDPEGVVHLRTLNDGSKYAVVKVYYNPASLRDVLTPHGDSLTIETTPRYFILATYRTSTCA